MNTIGYIFGEICKVLLPTHEEVFFGSKKSSIAICTLSSISLLKEIAQTDILDKVAIIGRLYTENEGIDTLVKYVNSNKNIKTIIICGKEVWGHKAGHSLLCMHQNGIDGDGRIISSTGADPFLKISQKEIEQFQNQVTIIDKIGETNPVEIRQVVETMSQ